MLSGGRKSARFSDDSNPAAVSWEIHTLMERTHSDRGEPAFARTCGACLRLSVLVKADTHFLEFATRAGSAKGLAGKRRVGRGKLCFNLTRAFVHFFVDRRKLHRYLHSAACLNDGAKILRLRESRA